jgi:flavin-dependent dehydrogenase
VTKPYDVVMIGAEPAGSAAATGVASAGWHVLSRKAAFPHDKVCGDFLSCRSNRAKELCVDTVEGFTVQVQDSS